MKKWVTRCLAAGALLALIVGVTLVANPVATKAATNLSDLELSGTLAVTGESTLSSNVNMSDGTVLYSGTTTGTTLVSSRVAPKNSVATSARNFHVLFNVGEVSGATYDNLGDVTKPTYGLQVNVGRESHVATSAFSTGSADHGARVIAVNKAANNAAYSLTGAFIKARNYSGGTVGTLTGCRIEAVNAGTATATRILDLGVDEGTSTTDIRFQYGETLDNATDGTFNFTGNSIALDSASGVAAGGSKAVSVKIVQATGTALTGVLRGVYIRAQNGGTAAANGTIRAIEAKATAASCDGTVGNTIGTLTGIYTSADSKAKTVTNLRGAEITLDGAAGSTTTTAVGLLINNNSSGTQTTSYGISINGGTTSGHKAFTADIQLGNGVLIMAGSGSPDGTLTAPIGSLYLQTDGAVDAQLWVNEDGSTAWGYVGTT